MADKFKIDTTRHLADGMTKAFIVMNLAPKGYYVLTTIGRTSGVKRTTPVVLVEEEGHRWLVAPFGPVGWVHNARAAGKVMLSRKGKSETLAIRELAPLEAAPVLRKYVNNVPVVRRYFDVGVDSPVEAYLVEAQKRPVFELSSLER
jgi:deazaflavin-dependent oxidoreductase (nitroreductase family)